MHEDADELQPEGTLALKPEDARGVATILQRVTNALTQAEAARQQAEVEVLAFEGVLGRINRGYSVDLPMGRRYWLQGETLQWAPMEAAGETPTA